jgi:type IV secretory pathway TrbF-like protein
MERKEGRVMNPYLKSDMNWPSKPGVMRDTSKRWRCRIVFDGKA